MLNCFTKGNKNVNQLLSEKSWWSWLTRSNGGIVSVGPRWARIDHVCHRAGHADRDQGWSPLPTTPNYSTPHSCSTPNTRQCSTRLYLNQVDSSPTPPVSFTEPCFQCLTPSSKKWDKCRMYDLFSIRCNLASFSTKVGLSKMQSSTNHLFYIFCFGQWCIIIRPNGPSAGVAAAEVSWEMTELTGVHCGYNWHLDTHDTLLQSNTNTNRNTYGKYNHKAIQKTSLENFFFKFRYSLWLKLTIR